MPILQACSSCRQTAFLVDDLCAACARATAESATPRRPWRSRLKPRVAWLGSLALALLVTHLLISRLDTLQFWIAFSFLSLLLKATAGRWLLRRWLRPRLAGRREPVKPESVANV